MNGIGTFHRGAGCCVCVAFVGVCATTINVNTKVCTLFNGFNVHFFCDTLIYTLDDKILQLIKCLHLV